jgi:hypothetical protein
MKFLLFWILALNLLHAGFIKSPESAIAGRYGAECVVTKKPVLLDNDAFARVEAKAPVKPQSRIFTFYLIEKEGKTLAHAALQTTMVRSKKQTALVFISPKGTIEAIEILAFYEPTEYLPDPKWLALFEGKNENDPLQPKRDLPNLTGATLSANTTARQAKTALLVWQEVFGRP